MKKGQLFDFGSFGMGLLIGAVVAAGLLYLAYTKGMLAGILG